MTGMLHCGDADNVEDVAGTPQNGEETPPSCRLIIYPSALRRPPVFQLAAYAGPLQQSDHSRGSVLVASWPGKSSDGPKVGHNMHQLEGQLRASLLLRPALRLSMTLESLVHSGESYASHATDGDIKIQ